MLNLNIADSEDLVTMYQVSLFALTLPTKFKRNFTNIQIVGLLKGVFEDTLQHLF